MKKILSVFMFLTILSAGFAKDIFSGKVFKEAAGSKFEFTLDGKIVLSFQDKPWCEFKYKVDEKQNLLVLNVSTLTFAAAGIDIADYAQDANLRSIKEIQKFLDSKEYENKMMLYMLGIPKKYQDFVNFKDSAWQNTVFNIACFMQLYDSDGKSEAVYNPDEDYTAKVAEYNEVSSEKQNASNEYYKSILSARCEMIKSQIDAQRFLFKEQSFPTFYDYEFEDETLVLTESAKASSPQRLFFATEYYDTPQNESDPAYAVSCFIFMVQNSNSSKIYYPKKLPSKDSGIVTFISKTDKKDSFDLKYEIKRDTELSVNGEILSGEFKGKKFSSTPILENMRLTLEH